MLHLHKYRYITMLLCVYLILLFFHTHTFQWADWLIIGIETQLTDSLTVLLDYYFCAYV